MTLYIAVNGTDPETLDAVDDELIADTVHQLLHEEVLVQVIETVGIVENLESEIERAVISNESLQVLANEASQLKYSAEPPSSRSDRRRNGGASREERSA